MGIMVYSLPHVFRDVYEGTRMATAEDLPGIRKIIRPLEDSGVLVRRTDTEVC
jgi:amino-acid N-acetyltransferase